MEGDDHMGGGDWGGGGGWHILKTTHSVCILTLKAVTIKKQLTHKPTLVVRLV